MKYSNNGNTQEETATIPSKSVFKERSEAAQEIISKKSSFLERWALLIFMSLMLCMAIGAWFIKYPDFISGRAILFGEISPSEIVVKQSGTLISVDVKNNQSVKAGEILGWLAPDVSLDTVDTKYGLRSPADGQVEFMEPVQQNKHLEQGKIIGYIIPANDRYFAQVKISQSDLSKIDTSMRVQLRISAYPYRESGYVPGKLIYISNVAVDSAFTGTILLDKGLVTNRNRAIPFKAGLQAEAVIITKEMRLLERLYANFVRH